MIHDKTFYSSYCLEIDKDLGSGTGAYYYPGTSQESGKDGVLVTAYSEQGDIWTGIFASGTSSPRGATGVYHLPDPNRFCVVAKGDGYIANANDPTDWQKIPLVPLLEVRCSECSQLLLVVNYTEIAAYGKHGHKWTTDRLSWNDLRIKEVNESEVIAEYWDIRAQADREVRVALQDGGATGAAQFP